MALNIVEEEEEEEPSSQTPSWIGVRACMCGNRGAALP